ncbi:glycosyl hydrolase family 28-related protein [Citrobacter freundii]|uniref:tail fiber/spike domain-containing protein n=1 Tax=Citrobacter freundii TaxID=546 RepID=UPI0013F04BC2|nr:glycosyl hydrolase family 28-related protein [Citrobacter freundii]MDV1141381.1 glycosyl hydrolase family 28-related protein [Citrobacter freundii]MDV1161610.1 glycosyl hydrolase family 28-related protein [Citrobacter freundii]MDV1167273.1 glycosyl hydrolase family 28-related protein [Citrobacter freundii]MEB0446880.1 glycosyl hydrolase family 28-related protein [Citrobacter freundii]MEB0456963.1 glycosyl hydrolase family 28-related protein [Citrobacter freundii]
MTTYNTGNPLGSAAAKDLYDNAQNFDFALNNLTQSIWLDRFGVGRRTWFGLEVMVANAAEKFGYITLIGVTFTTGATVKINEVLLNTANNTYYKWTGSFPAGGKIVPPSSTPESTGGIGPGKWLSVGDSTLRGELAESDGSGMVGHGDKTVDDALTELEKTQGKDGFNAIGRFLNLAELRAFPPSAVGDVVFVASAASSSSSEIHYGGGYFQAVAKGSLVDDGGVVIVPTTGTFAWKRIVNDGIYSVDMFGAKPDSVTDSGDAFIKAMTYARLNKIVMNASPGKYLTHTGIPIWKKSGLKGGGIGVTTIARTTNDTYHVTTGKDIDAYVLFLGDNMDVDDYTADCENAYLSGITFIRDGLTGRDNNTQYGLWMPKLNVSIIDNVRLECPYIGIWGEDVWFNKIHAQILGLGVKQFYGVFIAKIRSGSYLMSGTSNDLMIGVTNYQIGHFYAGQQYTTMTSCTCDNCEPMTDLGETDAVAYQFINPVGITMNSCGSEGVAGSRLSVAMTSDALYDSTIVINTYQGMIEQRNPSVSTPIYRVQSSHTTKNLSVIFNACNIKKDGTLTNQTVGFVGGANTYLNNIGSVIDSPTVSGGAVFKSL